MHTAAANGKLRAYWLRRIRIDRGLIQGQLAEKVAVSTTQISRYERGLDDPGLEIFDRLLIVLECWYGDLLADPAAPTPPRRFMDRPTHDVTERSIEIVINEFAYPTRPPESYPARMRCWTCHGRPGECDCYSICKVCRLPFQRSGKCSGVLHA